MDQTKEELQETIRQQAIKNGKLTEQLQAAEIECVRLNNRIEELESMLSEESDLVSRIALRNTLYDADAITMQGVKIVNQFPAVNAVPVVRCEKCKHAVWDEETKLWKCVESAEYDEELGDWFGFCEYHYGDYFCSYGEQKEGIDNG